MSHLLQELRYLPPAALREEVPHLELPVARPLRPQIDRMAAADDHHGRAASAMAAASAATGLVWGLVRPSGSSHAPAHEWVVASGVCALFAACIGAHMHAAPQATGARPLSRGDVSTLLLMGALGLFCGRTVGNTVGCLVRLMRF